MRCVILDDYQNVALQMADWTPLDGRVTVEALDHHIEDPSTLAAALERAAIVVAMRERTAFDAALLARLPDLKLLITTGMVNASIDIAAANRQGVTVCGTDSLNGGTAELVWGLLVSLARSIPQESAAMRADGHWQSTVGLDLQGRTMGIAGLGKLGRRVARVAAAFDMNVVAWSRSLTRASAAEAGIGHCETFADLLARSDVVSLHLPLTPATRGLVGADELAAMKPGAILVNTSRGPLVDETALIAALAERRIRGACLDVYDREPLPPGHPFRVLPNVVATPHLGYVTEGNYRRYFSSTVENIVAFLDGAPLRVLEPKSPDPTGRP